MAVAERAVPGKARRPGVLAFAATLAGASMLLFGRRDARHSPAAGRGSRSGTVNPDSLQDGYEVLDANPVSIIKWAGLLLGFALTMITLMILMVNFLDATTVRDERRLTPEQTAAIAVPLPHLQAPPYLDLQAERAHEDGLISGYAWIGARHAKARIPIGRAMTLSIGRSLDLGPLNLGPAGGSAPAADGHPAP